MFFDKDNLSSVFEIHYTFNGIKRWDMIHAKSETDATDKLTDKHNCDLININAIFEYKLKSFRFFDEPI